MFNSKKVTISKSLYDRLIEVAEQGGYSSTDEFVTHVLEREISKLGAESDQKHAEDQLRGLGYLE